jgi:N-acetyl sugar amidotransferase
MPQRPDWQRYELPDVIRYCNRCVSVNTRPGLTIDDEGVCSACRAYESRASVDWAARWGQLEALCERYRGDGEYDVLIPVSSGKDSSFIIDTLKNRLGMRPLLVSVMGIGSTATGAANADWQSDYFDCPTWHYRLPRRMLKTITRKAFERLLSPTWLIDLAIYSVPYRVAISQRVPFVVGGENIAWEYGGPGAKDDPCMLDIASNDVIKPVPLLDWTDDGVDIEQLLPLAMPSPGVLRTAGIDAHFMSYYVPWSGHANAQAMRGNGWQSLDDTGEWVRDGLGDGYDQIDDAAYLVHPWCKSVKLLHSHNTDNWSRAIRAGRATRAEAVDHVIANDYKLDPRMLREFLAFVERDETWFWCVVDSFANRRGLEKRGGEWRLAVGAKDALRRGGILVE